MVLEGELENFRIINCLLEISPKNSDFLILGLKITENSRNLFLKTQLFILQKP